MPSIGSHLTPPITETRRNEGRSARSPSQPDGAAKPATLSVPVDPHAPRRLLPWPGSLAGAPLEKAHLGSDPELEETVLLVPEMSAETRTPAEKFLFNKRHYGAAPEQFEAFYRQFGAYAQSASTGQQLASLNDIDGVLIFDARDGDLVNEERWAVVRNEGEYYVKGYGDRIVRLEDLRKVLEANQRRGPEERAAHLKDLEEQLREKRNMQKWERPLMETTIRSEILLLSLKSELMTRRSATESAEKLIPLPPNPTEMPAATNWANSEIAMCPGAGPLLPNGTRQYALDVNSVENKLIGFKNTSGEVPRDPAIISTTVKGQKAPVLVSGPVLFELEGIKKWQLVGPATEQSGVKGGIVPRLAAATGRTVMKLSWSAWQAAAGLVRSRPNAPEGELPLPVQTPARNPMPRESVEPDRTFDDMLRLSAGIPGAYPLGDVEPANATRQEGRTSGDGDGPEETLPTEGNFANIALALKQAKPGAVIRITTEDDAVHDLTLTTQGISLEMHELTHGGSSNSGWRALGVGGQRSEPCENYARVYSYLGRNTGRYGTESGVTDPQLLLSSGERVKVGPLVASPDTKSSLTNAALRAALYQPNFVGRGATGYARLANTMERSAGKYLTTLTTSAVTTELKDRFGHDGVFLRGAQIFSGIGSGKASANDIALSTALIIFLQELINFIKEEITPMVPPGWQKPDNKLLQPLATGFWAGAEELVRLETNLGVQKRLGLRAGTPWDHRMLMASAAVTGIIETMRDSIPGPEVWPTAHMALDFAKSGQYTLLRVAGMVLGAPENPTWLDYWEALINRALVRGYDQVVAPLVVHVLNRTGWIGDHADPFAHQLAHERRIQSVGTAIKDALVAGYRHDWQPLGKLIGDGRMAATVRADIEKLLVGNFDRSPLGFLDEPPASNNPLVKGPAAVGRFIHDRTQVRRSLADTEFLTDWDIATLQLGDLGKARIKQMLNRVDLTTFSLSAIVALISHVYSTVAESCRPAPEPDLEAGRAAEAENEPSPEAARIASRVEQAIEMQELSDFSDPGKRTDYDRKWEAIRSGQEARIAVAEKYARHEYADDIEPTTNNLSEASAAQRRFAAAQGAALQGKHDALFEAPDKLKPGLDDSVLRAVVPHPVQPDYSLKLRPAAGAMTRLGVPDALRKTGGGISKARTKRGIGTFANDLQRAAWKDHLKMRHAQGTDALQSVAVQQDRPLSKAMLKRIILSLIRYTEESQFFHYPLRWQVTGEALVLKVAPGVTVRYNVMNMPGNIKGDKDRRIDPIEAVHANLAALRAPKFPGPVVRAVVTEAKYRDSGEDTEGEIIAGRHFGVMTEIFSASTNSDVTAHFNLPISGFGASPRENSQRIDLIQETGLKISDISDLAQAEVILMPGAVIIFRKVDANAGKSPGKHGDQDIGQVVYAEQVNTYKLEESFYDCVERMIDDTRDPPADGTQVIDPRTGQFFKYAAHPARGETLYDPEEQVFYKYGEAKTEFRGGLRFDSATKSYFLGRSLEYGTNPATQQALWLHPYTGETAKRTTKDAIHAAIVRGDDIVEHLDEAIKNPHHEFYRQKDGFYRTAPGPDGREQYVNRYAAREAQTIADTKRHAAAIVKAELGSDQFAKPQGDAATEMLAWATTSYLRKPIKLVPVGDYAGLPKQGLLIKDTYDKVDLVKHPLDKKPDEPVLIGVGEDGYYAIEHENGEFKATHRIEGDSKGRTAENFLQAYLRAGPLGAASYGKVAAPHEDDVPSWVPDRDARKSGKELFEKISKFLATDYIVLQDALVTRRLMAEARILPSDASAFDVLRILGKPDREDARRARAALRAVTQDRATASTEPVPVVYPPTQRRDRSLDPEVSSLLTHTDDGHTDDDGSRKSVEVSSESSKLRGLAALGERNAVRDPSSVARRLLREARTWERPIAHANADHLGRELLAIRDQLSVQERRPLLQLVAEYLDPEVAGLSSGRMQHFVEHAIHALDEARRQQISLSHYRLAAILRSRVDAGTAADRVALEEGPLHFAHYVPDLWNRMPMAVRQRVLRDFEAGRHGVNVMPGDEAWLDDRQIGHGFQALERRYRPLEGRVRLVRPYEAFQILNDPTADFEALAHLDPDYRQTHPQLDDVLVLPLNDRGLNEDGSHHSFLVVDRQRPGQPTAYHHDSAGAHNIDLARQLAEGQGWHLVPARTARQQDGYSCGDRVLAGIESYLQQLLVVRSIPDGGLDLGNLDASRERTWALLGWTPPLDDERADLLANDLNRLLSMGKPAMFRGQLALVAQHLGFREADSPVTDEAIRLVLLTLRTTARRGMPLSEFLAEEQRQAADLRRRLEQEDPIEIGRRSPLQLARTDHNAWLSIPKELREQLLSAEEASG